MPLRLVVVRGWPAEGDDLMARLLGLLAEGGMAVEDVFVDPAGCGSMAEWATLVVGEIDRRLEPSEPRLLLGYCLGGHVTIEVTAALTAQGRPPTHVALVDTWDRSPAYQLSHGIYRRYRVGWRRRVRHQLQTLTRPGAVRVAPAAGHYGVALVKWIPRWVSEVVVQRGRPRLRKSHWWGLHLAYDWTYSVLDVPVHRYNAEVSIIDNDGDPSMGLAANFRGGSVLRRIGGDHITCLREPHVERLAALVVADLASPLAIAIPMA